MTTAVVAALLLGLGTTASGASSSSKSLDGVSRAEAELTQATAARVAADERLNAARSRFSEVDVEVSRLGAVGESLTKEIADARRAVREFAVAAYIDGGKADIVRSSLDPQKAQALAWQSNLSAGQATSATEVAREFKELKAANSPARVEAAKNLERTSQALEEAGNDAIQASAFERDAEAALTQAKVDAAARAVAEAQAREQQRAAVERDAAAAAAPRAATPVTSSGQARGSAGSPAAQSAPAPASTGRGDPSPSESATLAKIRRCESHGNYSIVSASGRYRGAYQFDYRTWAGIGGSGDPAAAAPSEQDYRALLLMRSRGTRPWPVCGR